MDLKPREIAVLRAGVMQEALPPSTAPTHGGPQLGSFQGAVLSSYQQHLEP